MPLQLTNARKRKRTEVRWLRANAWLLRGNLFLFGVLVVTVAAFSLYKQIKGIP